MTIYEKYIAIRHSAGNFPDICLARVKHNLWGIPEINDTRDAFTRLMIFVQRNKLLDAVDSWWTHGGLMVNSSMEPG